MTNFDIINFSFTIDLSTRLWGKKTHKLCIYSPEPCAEVYCFRLNFNISKLVYYTYVRYSRFCKFDCNTQTITNNVHAIIIFTQLANSKLHTAADEEEPFTSVQPPLSSSPSLVFNLVVFFSLTFFFCLPLSSGPFSLHRKKTASVNSSNQCFARFIKHCHGLLGPYENLTQKDNHLKKIALSIQNLSTKKDRGKQL